MAMATMVALGLLLIFSAFGYALLLLVLHLVFGILYTIFPKVKIFKTIIDRLNNEGDKKRHIKFSEDILKALSEMDKDRLDRFRRRRRR
jgi:type IV secretory pathway VirB3-like protein